MNFSEHIQNMEEIFRFWGIFIKLEIMFVINIAFIFHTNDIIWLLKITNDFQLPSCIENCFYWNTRSFKVELDLDFGATFRGNRNYSAINKLLFWLKIVRIRQVNFQSSVDFSILIAWNLCFTPEKLVLQLKIDQKRCNFCPEIFLLSWPQKPKIFDSFKKGSDSKN